MACKKQDDPKPAPAPAAPAASPSPPAAASAQPAAAVDAGPPAAPADAPAGALVAREDGVGPLGATTAVSRKQLLALLPGYQVKHVSIPHGGDLREDYWGVSKHGKLVLRVQTAGSTLSAVDIVGDDVVNPFGITLGQRYAEVDKSLGPLDCENAGDATDWRANIVVCTFKSSTYSLDFAYNDDAIYDAKEMLADPAKLAKARLVAITWEPPRGPR